MITYTVHEPPDPPADRLDRAERLVFVKDGFCWGAAFFGPFWFLARRLWTAALAYVLILVALVVGFDAAGLTPVLGVALTALNVIVGFEASALYRWSLERRGWTFAGTVVDRNLTQCERRFFEAWLPGEPVISAGPQGSARSGTTSALEDPGPPFPRRWRRLLGAGT